MDPAPNAPTVSVALCSHNGARFVAEQVRSILTQEFSVTEIVLSDDASGDGTVEIVTATVEEHRLAHPAHGATLRILLNETPLGVAGNFTRAISACTSELIALSDQDDVWLPGRLSAVVADFAAREDLTLLHGDAIRIDSDGRELPESLFETLQVSRRELRHISKGEAFRVFVRRNLATGATVVFRRGLAAVALPVPSGWIHDEWLAIVAAATGVVDADLRKLIGYRQHDLNQIGARPLDFATRMDRLREARTPRNARLLARATSLVERFEYLGTFVRPADLALARGKLRHERFRSGLPRRRLLRALPIAGAALRGRYSRYGLGAKDVLRDLVQPVD